MTMSASADPRYPVGRFERVAEVSAAARADCIEHITRLPERLAEAVSGLTTGQLDTPYREGGWTVRQLVHHVADSHMNAYIRMKLAVTETDPPIKTYDEKAWAGLEDGRHAPIEISLDLVRGLHGRWVWFLKSLDPTDFAKTVRHPELGALRVDDLVQLYGWHCRHHVAHITALRRRQGW